MVLEFFHCFGEELQLKDNFPAGLTFDLLERAVFENEVSGPLSDIIQVLLSSLFEYQDAEAEEVKEANSGDQQDQEVTESGPTYQVLNRFSVMMILDCVTKFYISNAAFRGRL
jgi:bromodomain adjacent to zinc finger domain protein 1A